MQTSQTAKNSSVIWAYDTHNISAPVLKTTTVHDDTLCQDGMALLSILAMGKREIETGQCSPAHEVFARLRTRLNAIDDCEKEMFLIVRKSRENSCA